MRFSSWCTFSSIALFSSCCNSSFLCASSNNLYVACCISACTQASSKYLYVECCNYSRVRPLPTTSASLIVIPHRSRPPQATFVSRIRALLVIFLPLWPFVHRAKTTFVERHQTWEGDMLPFSFSPLAFDLIFHHARIPFSSLLCLELSHVHQLCHLFFYSHTNL